MQTFKDKMNLYFIHTFSKHVGFHYKFLIEIFLGKMSFQEDYKHPKDLAKTEIFDSDQF